MHVLIMQIFKQFDSEKNQNLWNVRSEACAVDCGVIMSIIRGIDTHDDVTCTRKGRESFNHTLHVQSLNLLHLTTESNCSSTSSTVE